jgi:uncharacterized membrane protein
VQNILYFFGHGFCHQIPARSFETGGLYFAVCARDTGIHMGVALALLVAFLLSTRSKRKPGDIPPVRVLVLLGLLVVPMAFDGLSSYLGFRETTNLIRYFTGLCTGIAVGTLIAPLLLALRRDSDRTVKAFNTPVTAALQLLSSFALGTLFFFALPLLEGLSSYVAPLIALTALFVFVGSINLLVLSISRRFAPAGSGKRWAILIGLTLVFLLAEVVLMGAIHHLLLSVFTDGRTLTQLFFER